MTISPQPIADPSTRADERPHRVSDTVERATEQASEATLARATDLRDRTERSLTRSRDEVAQRIRHVGGVLRSVTEELRTKDEDLAGYAEVAVKQIDRVATYVDHASLRTVKDDLTALARSQPVPFFGGAFLLGFSLGRLLKNAVDDASSTRDVSGSPMSTRGSLTARGPRAGGRSPRSDDAGDAGFEEHYPVREPSTP